MCVCICVYMYIYIYTYVYIYIYRHMYTYAMHIYIYMWHERLWRERDLFCVAPEHPPTPIEAPPDIRGARGRRPDRP